VVGNILRGVAGTAHYVDIIVYAATADEHDKPVIEVLERLN
jgi:hypothetical protein